MPDTLFVDEFDQQAARRNSPYLGNWALPVYRAAKAALLTGGASFDIAFIGGSSTMGLGANTGTGGLADSYQSSFPSVVARALVAAGVPTRYDAWDGDNNTATNLTAFRPNVTPGAFTVASVGRAPAGNGFFHNGSGTATFTIAKPADPALVQPFNNVQVRYINRGANGSPFTGTSDGGAALTPVGGGSSSIATGGADGTQGVVEFQIDGAVTTHTFAINAPAASGSMNRVEIGGIRFSNTTRSEIRIRNLGTSGASADYWANTSPALKRAMIWNTGDPMAINPKLSVFLLSNNDMLQKFSVAKFKTDMTALITLALTVGDVLLCVQQPMGEAAGASFANADTTAATQAAFRAAILELANSFSPALPVFDSTAIMPSYQDGVALDQVYDVIHYKKQALFYFGNSLGRALAA